MKRLKITAIMIAISFLILPLLLLGVGVFLPPQFEETYYGEYSVMVEKLHTIKGKKVVFLGNSAIPFGIQSDLVAEELDGYEVVNFGLYGSIGTKAMMSAAKSEIGEGDIVILLPEVNASSLSLAFSGEQFLYAVDGNFAYTFPQNEWESIIASYPRFLSEKVKRLFSEHTTDPVYAKNSFVSADGTYKDYITKERSGNQMATGWDENDSISLSTALSDGFLAYVSAYQSFVEGKGATFYFGFAPVNRLALGVDTLETLYRKVRSSGISVLGTPDFSVMDHEWFFDSNYHLNSAGSIVFSARIAEQIKAELGQDTPVKIELPEKPPMTIVPPKEGNDEDIDCFLYEEGEEFVRIVGLSDLGKTRSELTIPSTYHQKRVVSFEKTTFQNNLKISRVTLGANIKTLYDGSFEGCEKLIAVVLTETDPNLISVGKGLLKGAENAKIYVPQSSQTLFATHYFWQYYKAQMESYS